ncbi:MAG: hypothetical protein EU547_03030 [Promethearchaeota archaeon]|nr:MAG: hypothetical protein EU547_03030 [Candidatus Lokiarchaeota archaeon]
MAYIEKSTSFIIKRTVLGGFRTLSKGINLFYSLITLILMILNTISFFLIPYIGLILFQTLLTVQISVMISFLIISIINYITKSTALRLITSISVLVGVIIPSIFFSSIILDYMLIINSVIIFSGLILITLNTFLLIRNVYNSWYTRLLMIGKSRKHFLFENLIKILSILSLFLFLFPIYGYLTTFNPFELLLACIGIITGIINLIAIYVKSEYEFHDIFLSIITNIYLISFIFLFFYYENSLLVIFGDLIIFSVVILSLIQNIKYWGKEDGIFAVKIDKEYKKTKSPVYSEKDKPEIIIEDGQETIIIIDEEEKYPKKDVEIPIRVDKNQIKNRNSFYIIILTVALSFHLLFLWYFQSYYGLNLFSLFLISDFSMLNYSLCIASLISVILVFLLYKISTKFQNFLTFPPNVRKAFLEFLSLMNKKERTKLLRAMSKTIQQIILEGLIDLLESEKGNIIDTIGEGIRRGAKFFRRMFGDEDEE